MIFLLIKSNLSLILLRTQFRISISNISSLQKKAREFVMRREFTSRRCDFDSISVQNAKKYNTYSGYQAV